MGKRVILLTQWFEPEPTFKGLVFARELHKRGFDVEVVTGFPNYPTGTLYPGFRMSWRKQQMLDGVLVTRLPLYPSHDASALHRVTNYVSFALAAATYCTFQAKHAELIYIYQLPTLGVVGALVKVIRGSRTVLDVTDIWPDTLAASGMVTSDRLLRAVGWLARQVYRQADAVVATTPGFRRLLLDRGVPERKLHMIYNWCDERALEIPADPEAVDLRSDSRFTIMFAGNMGKLQALTAVIDAAEILADRDAKIRFIFIGGGVDTENLKAITQERGLTNVVFLPRVSMDRIGAYLERADALLVHLKADPLFEITVPGKTQAYMAMGKPILIATRGDAAELVRAANCGVEAVPENPLSIADAALRMAAMPVAELAAMGDRGKAYYADYLSVAAGVDKFTSIFKALIRC